MKIFKRTVDGKKQRKRSVKLMVHGESYTVSLGTSDPILARKRAEDFRDWLEGRPKDAGRANPDEFTKGWTAAGPPKGFTPTLREYADPPTADFSGGPFWLTQTEKTKGTHRFYRQRTKALMGFSVAD